VIYIYIYIYALLIIASLTAIASEWQRRIEKRERYERYERQLDRWARDVCKDIDVSQITSGIIDTSKIECIDGVFTFREDSKG